MSNHPKERKEDDELILMVVFVAIFFFVLYFSIRFAALIAEFVYAPFTFHVKALGSLFGTAGSALAMIITSASILGAWWFFDIKKRGNKTAELGFGQLFGKNWLLGWGIIWGVFALMEISSGYGNSSFLAHIEVFCNPLNDNAFYLFSCQNGFGDFAQMSASRLMVVSFVPNMIMLYPITHEIATSPIRLRRHPKIKAKKNLNRVDALIEHLSKIYPSLSVFSKYNPNAEKDLKGRLTDGTSGPMRLADSPRRFVFENDIVKGFGFRPRKNGSGLGRQFVIPLNYETMQDTIKKDVNKDLKKIESDFDEAFPKIKGKSDKETELLKAKANRRHQIETSFYRSHLSRYEGDYTPILDEDKLTSIYEEQLGDIWTGPDHLKAEELIILAIMLPRACCSDTEMTKDEAREIINESDELIDDVWRFLGEGVCGLPADISRPLKKGETLTLDRFPFLNECRDTVRTFVEHEVVKDLLNKHAYTYSFLISVILIAREMGVVQPAKVRWMKFYNRGLWYLIQNVQRPSVFVENAGAMSHYILETKAGTRLYNKRVELAVEGTKENLNEYIYSRQKIEAWLKYKNSGDSDNLKKLRVVSEFFDLNK